MFKRSRARIMPTTVSPMHNKFGPNPHFIIELSKPEVKRMNANALYLLILSPRQQATNSSIIK